MPYREWREASHSIRDPRGTGSAALRSSAFGVGQAWPQEPFAVTLAAGATKTWARLGHEYAALLGRGCVREPGRERQDYLGSEAEGLAR